MLLTTDVSKILKTFQRDLTFIFDLLSKSLFGFAFIFGFLGCRKCCYVYKKTFLQRTSQRNNAQLCRNVLAQSWLQYGIKVFNKIFVLQKTEMCEPSSKHHNSETGGTTTPCSYIFVNILQFLYQFHYLKGKSFQRRSKKILISLYIKPGNLALMGHGNFVFFFLFE